LSNVLGFPIQVQPPPLIDDPSVPEVFADNVAGLTITHGNANFTFATIRADHTKTPATHHRKITNRVVMPVAVAMNLYELLGQAIQQLEANGIIQKGAQPPPPVMQ
jgi:hypothetical protein